MSALADARYTQVQGITGSVVSAVQALWADVTPDRILAAMAGETGKQILNAVITGQLSAAAGAQAFVTRSMMMQGAGGSPLGRLVPGSFAGIASDGRALASMLYLPAVTTAHALQLGLGPEAAAARGLNQLAYLVATQVADSARVATSVAMTAEPRCRAYVRVVKLPACSRCIVLAGKQYSYSTGFQRHPKCNCGMEPMSDAEWRASAGPEDLFRQMTPDERATRFGKAGAEAIANGADIGQVVNARRGMATTTTGKKVTREGTAKRGIGGKALNVGYSKANAQGSRYSRTREARLMPEQIIKNAAGDRDLQVALLRKHGYIT